MNIDNFKPAIVYTIYIASTPEKVWQALTIGGILPAIFFRQCGRGRSAGSAAHSSCARRMARCISAAKCSNAIRRSKLTFTFNVNWPALIEKLGPTLVTYEIEPAGEAVKLTHDRNRMTGRSTTTSCPAAAQGWPAILSSLKSLLETGHALVIKMAPPQRMLDGAEADGDRDAVAGRRVVPANTVAALPRPALAGRGLG